MGKYERNMAKRMTNKELLGYANALRIENENKRKYGTYHRPNQRTVTHHEFLGKSGGVGSINKEIARRRAAGTLRKTAGKKRRSSSGGFGGYGWNWGGF